MIDYSTFKAEDFLLEDDFIDYCKNKNEHKEFWEALSKKHPGIEIEINKALRLFEIISLKTSSEEKELELTKLKAVLLSSKPVEEPARPIRIETNFNRIKYFVAAAIILGIIAAGSIWYNSALFKQDVQQEYSLEQFKMSIIAPSDARKEVVLPDGSTVLLNYGSTIRVEENYNEKDRRIYLEGEAFFTVQPDTKRPFTVLSKFSQTTALGTSFKVKDFPGDHFSNVMLVTGKVKVVPVTKQKNHEEFTLNPGQQLTFDQSGKAIAGTFIQQQFADWKNNHIIFEGADLSAIMRNIEFYYGVKIVLQNEPKNRVALTGQFENKPLKDVLEAISYTNKLTYSQKQNTIYIHFNEGLK